MLHPRDALGLTTAKISSSMTSLSAGDGAAAAGAGAAAGDYTPRSILFTGGAGFIGSHVLKLLMDRFPDCRFVCLDRMDYCASVHNLDAVKDREQFVFVRGDITSVDLVNHIMASYKIDTVLHFAAQTHVDNSFGNSFSFTETNVMGTHVLLESCRLFHRQVRRFVHVSTDEVYGESSASGAEDSAFNESSALNPTNPYAATKAAAEFMVKAYHTSFGLPTIITRGNNVYGPQQYPEKLIPKFINLLARGKPCPIHGDGTHRRSFIHVDDVSEAYYAILCKGEVGSIYNIGTDFEISNLEVTRTLLRMFGLQDREDEFIKFVHDRHFNDVRYNIARSKLDQLGWAPRVAFEEGLRRTIDWYAANPDHFEHVDAALVAHPRYGVSTHNLSAISVLVKPLEDLPKSPRES